MDKKFTFKVSEVFIDEQLKPYKNIVFEWDVEQFLDSSVKENKDELFEKIGEQLKRDFMVFLQKQNTI